MTLMELFVKIGADMSGLDEGIDKSESKALSFAQKIGGGLKGAAKIGATAVAAVGAAAAAGTTAMIKGATAVADYGDNIDKMSQKMGLSAEAYQEWDAVMRHSGTSMESMKASMKTLANAAETGNEAFAALGITEEQLAKLNQQELFEATISALQNVESTTERTYLAGKLLGRGATELGALLNMSAEDTDKMRQRVHELGGVMSDEAVKNSAQFKDNLQDLQTAFSGLKRGIIMDVLPGFNMLMSGFTKLITNEEGAEEEIEKGVDNLLTNVEKGLEKATGLAEKLLPKILDVAVEHLPQFIDIGVDIMVALGDALIKAAPLIAEKVPYIISAFAEAFKENPEALLALAPFIIGKIVGGLSESGFLKLLKPAGKLIADNLGEHISSSFSSVATKIAPSISTSLSSLGSFMTADIGTTMAAGGSAAVATAGTAIVGSIAAFFGGAEVGKTIGGYLFPDDKELYDSYSGISGTFAMIKDAAVLAWEETGYAASDAWEGIKSGASESWETVQGAFSEVGNWFGEKFTEAKTNTVSAWGDIKSHFDQIWSNIKSAFNFGEAVTWGRDMIDNFISGIREKWEALKSTVVGVGQMIKDNIGHSHPKEGPLADDYTWMPDMMDLFAQGIKDGEKDVRSQIESTFDFGNIVSAPTLAGVPSGTTAAQPDVVSALTDALSNVTLQVLIGGNQLDAVVNNVIVKGKYRSGGR